MTATTAASAATASRTTVPITTTTATALVLAPAAAAEIAPELEPEPEPAPSLLRKAELEKMPPLKLKATQKRVRVPPVAIVQPPRTKEETVDAVLAKEWVSDGRNSIVDMG